MSLSVAMATFNGGRFIREQLDSIARQSMPPDELVICDDGSTDDTLEIIRGFATTACFPVVLVAHGGRLGYSDNFIQAIGHCSGEIVAMADQDDVWLERKLEVAIRPFADPDVLGVCHQVRYTDEQLKPTNTVLPAIAKTRKCGWSDIDPWTSAGGMHMLVHRPRLVPWLTADRPVSKYWPAPAVYDEFLFFLATVFGHLVMLKEVLALHRRHGTAVTAAVEGVEGQTVLSGAFQRGLAWSAGSAGYLHLAAVAAARADFAAMTRHSPRPNAPTASGGAVKFYRDVERAFRRRAAMYSQNRSFVSRLNDFLVMAAQGSYRPRRRGGLGVKSLAKDCFTTFAGRAGHKPT
jgi:hypothetical protein